MFAIYKKEMLSYFINPVGYVFAGIFLLFSALFFGYTTYLSGSYDTSTYFTVMIFAFIVLIPLLTMRLFAEERKMRTEQLLMTAPITLPEMVIGKFLASYIPAKSWELALILRNVFSRVSVLLKPA